jgi:HAD superfamily hydrolase (TIGR01509 family)
VEEDHMADYAIIWDVDGVLLDSAEQHRESWQEVARQHGLPYSDADFWATFGRRNSDVIPVLYQVAGPPERLEALANEKEAAYRDALRREASALPGAVDLMRALYAAGYAQALGSSAPVENLDLIVQLLGIGQYLGAVISGEMVARGKPAPDIFLAAAQHLGVVPARALVIEDAPAGVAAAHAGGMRCLAVRRSGQADPEGLDAADAVVDSLRDADVALVRRLLGQ